VSLPSYGPAGDAARKNASQRKSCGPSATLKTQERCHGVQNGCIPPLEQEASAFWKKARKILRTGYGKYDM